MIKIKKTVFEWAVILGMPFLEDSDDELYSLGFDTELRHITEEYCLSAYKGIIKPIDFAFNPDLVCVSVEFGELEEYKYRIRESRIKAVFLTLSQLFSPSIIRQNHPLEKESKCGLAGISSTERVSNNEIEIGISNPALFFNHIISKKGISEFDYMGDKAEASQSIVESFTEKYLPFALEVFEKNLVNPSSVRLAHVLIKNSSPRVLSHYKNLIKGLEIDEICERIFNQFELLNHFGEITEDFDINDVVKLASGVYGIVPQVLARNYYEYLQKKQSNLKVA